MWIYKHVDDLLVLSKDGRATRLLIDHLISEFKDVKHNTELTLPYLGNDPLRVGCAHSSIHGRICTRVDGFARHHGIIFSRSGMLSLTTRA